MCVYDTISYDCGHSKYHLAENCEISSPCTPQSGWFEAKAGLCEKCNAACSSYANSLPWDFSFPCANSCGQSGVLDKLFEKSGDDAEEFLAMETSETIDCKRLRWDSCVALDRVVQGVEKSINPKHGSAATGYGDGIHEPRENEIWFDAVEYC